MKAQGKKASKWTLKGDSFVKPIRTNSPQRAADNLLKTAELTCKQIISAYENSVIGLKALEKASVWTLSWDCFGKDQFVVVD